MYIDHLKRGAGGILSHDEGYFGSQEGFCTLKNDLETTLLDLGKAGVITTVFT